MAQLRLLVCALLVVAASANPLRMKSSIVECDAHEAMAGVSTSRLSASMKASDIICMPYHAASRPDATNLTCDQPFAFVQSISYQVLDIVLHILCTQRVSIAIRRTHARHLALYNRCLQVVVLHTKQAAPVATVQLLSMECSVSTVKQLSERPDGAQVDTARCPAGYYVRAVRLSTTDVPDHALTASGTNVHITHCIITHLQTCRSTWTAPKPTLTPAASTPTLIGCRRPMRPPRSTPPLPSTSHQYHKVWGCCVLRLK